MHGTEMLVAILIPLGLFAMVFGIVYMRTRENLAILEKGKDPRSPRPYRNLKNGLLFIGCGIGLVLAYLLDETMLHRAASEDFPVLYVALTAIGGGIGLVLSYRIEKREVLDKIDPSTHL